MKKPKAKLKPETKCFYYKGNGHKKWNCPRYLVDKKDAKVNEGICDIHVMCTLLVFIVAPEYLILVRLLNISNSKQELQNE